MIKKKIAEKEMSGKQKRWKIVYHKILLLFFVGFVIECTFAIVGLLLYFVSLLWIHFEPAINKRVLFFFSSFLTFPHSLRSTKTNKRTKQQQQKKICVFIWKTIDIRFEIRKASTSRCNCHREMCAMRSERERHWVCCVCDCEKEREMKQWIDTDRIAIATS